MSESVHELLAQLRAEWNHDAFLIEVRLLHRKCKELAHQQAATARRLKQPCDVTPEKLVALYKRQRGRCAISGVPMTWKPGLRHPTSINLDHIEDIRRDESLDAVSRGEPAVGGQAGMMTNIRFVCQAMHYIRNKLEDVTPDFGDLRGRLAVQLELGPPCNNDIDIDSVVCFSSSHEDVERAIDDITCSGKRRLSAKSVCQRLTMASISHSYHHVLRYLQNLYGCDAKSVEQRERVAIAARMFHENQQFLDLIGWVGRRNRTWFSVVDPDYLKALVRHGYDSIGADARQEDLCIAFQVVTGKLPPSTQSQLCRSSQCVRQKLSHWSRPTPATRAKVLDIIKSAGRGGIAKQELASLICSGDSLASLPNSNAYVAMVSAVVMQIADELNQRRLIDITEGVCVARLLLVDAAKYCGLTKNTLGKYHKTQIGPVCELATAGNGRMLSFAFCELDRWLACRPNRRDASCVLGNKASSGLPEFVASGLLFDSECGFGE